MLSEKFIKKQGEIIRSSIDRIEKDIKRKRYHDVGSSSDDSALEFEEFEESLALKKSEGLSLELLKLALRKIEDRSYGICEKCGAQIEEGRLEAYPEARYCATDAK